MVITVSTNSNSASGLSGFDADHLWHPYSTIPPAVPPVIVESAQGVRLKLDDGRELIDGMSSWWSAIHGYNHPELNAAVTEQLERMSHVMFGGITHAPAVTLGRQLLALAPAGLDKVFFADSGSVAVEVALKMAVQYWQSRDQPERREIIALRGGYHGDTLGCMAVCDPDNSMHHHFAVYLPERLFADRPGIRFGAEWNSDDIASLKGLLQDRHDEIAALVLEPIVQGAGGMWFYSADYLGEARRLCDEFDVLLIADEIATGFGRSGKMFACEHAGISPDILCLGKALTGGYMTLAATLCSDNVADGIASGDVPELMHGPTFMANPLACAVASRSIELLLDNAWEANIERIRKGLEQGFTSVEGHDGVREVRVLGAIGVIEMHEPVDMAVMQPAFVNKGVWVRPFGKLIYVMPPYVTSDKDLAILCTAIEEVIEETIIS
jgi:adenosylmethionine-8-amino-7-oxononanoate aminotransferase